MVPRDRHATYSTTLETRRGIAGDGKTCGKGENEVVDDPSWRKLDFGSSGWS
jgi:hypothetical protein